MLQLLPQRLAINNFGKVYKTMKVMYTRPEDLGVSIVTAAPKADIEKVLGPLTQEQYEAHVMERSVPADAINPRRITDDAIPANREFRNAWVDVTAAAKVDIDLVKAKEVKLLELRAKRNAELEKLDREFLVALEVGDALGSIRARKQALRDATEHLKALVVSGIDDELVLDQIRALSTLEINN